MSGGARHQFVVTLSVGLTLAVCACGRAPESGALTDRLVASGTLRGHVRLVGTPPENPPIRMRSDPMCDEMNQRQPMVFKAVVVDADGGLANVFVQVQGAFPAPPPPRDPVVLDQRGCIYYPRVVGAQLGQAIVVGNSDPGLHNVHGQSPTINEFNVAQPLAGMTNEVRPDTEGLITLRCDVHGWMLAFVHVVSHPHFAVSDTEGAFEVRNVPAGARTLRAWHEQYGELTMDVQVEADQATDVEFTYTTD